jgi:hypothetical protein
LAARSGDVVDPDAGAGLAARRVLELARRPAAGEHLQATVSLEGRARQLWGAGFDGVDDHLEAEGTEQVEGVLGAGKLGVDDRIGGDVAQRAGEVPGDLHGRHGVVVAVGDG